MFFDDAQVDVVLRERTESPLGGKAFLAGGKDGLLTAVVIQTEDGLSMDSFGDGRSFAAMSSPDSVYIAEYEAGDDDTPCETVVPDLSSSPLKSPAAADQPEATVDVLVAFDVDAAAWACSFGGGTTNFATVAVQKMNVALANSGLGTEFRFRLVGTVEVPASAATSFQGTQADLFNGTLDAAQSGSGVWVAVKNARDLTGADLVTTLIDTGSAYGITGLGFALKTTKFASFSENPFNVCSIRAVATGHTMTHECGHNIGAGHATAVNTAQISPGPQLYDYSAGHFFTGTNGVPYHSIMAYNWDGFGNHYTEAPLFSSPNCPWRGTASGDATHDNVRTIRQTWAAASQWRASKVPASYDVFFSPKGGTDFENSLEVTLTPGKTGLDIRYTLDDTDPTLSSPLYSGPITITNVTTIRAAAVTDGVLGPIYRAYYGPDPIAIALDCPGLRWTNEPGNPWVVQTDRVHMGDSAMRSPMLSPDMSGSFRLQTVVTGPTNMTFRYQKHFATGSKLQILSAPTSNETSVTQLFIDNRDGTASQWRLAEFAVPEGEHYVTFTYVQGSSYYEDQFEGYVFNGVWLDAVRFGTLSRTPTVLPASTDIDATATTFSGPLEISIVPPEGIDGTLWYTTDGSAPDGEDGRPYEGPFTISESTLVRAVFVEPDRDPSVEARALYLERHLVAPGEWSPDPGSAISAAAADPSARLVVLMLYALTSPDTDCDAFTPLAYDPAFLGWCADNGIYLVVADPFAYLESTNAENWFWALHDTWMGAHTGTAQVPGFYFVHPNATNTPLAQGVAMVDPNTPYTIGSVPYDGTMEALIAGFESVIASNCTPAAVEAGGATIPISWLERRYSGEAATSNEWVALALRDTDGDGFATWQEFLAGSDPTNAESRLFSTVKLEDGNPVFGFSPTNATLDLRGYRYAPTGKTNLEDSVWSPFGQGHRFYRITIVPK